MSEVNQAELDATVQLLVRALRETPRAKRMHAVKSELQHMTLMPVLRGIVDGEFIVVHREHIERVLAALQGYKFFDEVSVMNWEEAASSILRGYAPRVGRQRVWRKGTDVTVACTTPECGWHGRLSECEEASSEDSVIHSFFCPNCRFVTTVESGMKMARQQ